MFFRGSNIWNRPPRPRFFDPERPTSIYALIDPRTGGVGYVGATGDPRKRWSQHRTEPGYGRKQQWLRELRSVGLEPVMRILEEVPWRDAPVAERAWIRKMLANNEPLTNTIFIEREGLQTRRVELSAQDVDFLEWLGKGSLSEGIHEAVEYMHGRGRAEEAVS